MLRRLLGSVAASGRVSLPAAASCGLPHLLRAPVAYAVLRCPCTTQAVNESSHDGNRSTSNSEDVAVPAKPVRQRKGRARPALPSAVAPDVSADAAAIAPAAEVVVVRRKRGRPRKVPLPATAVSEQPVHLADTRSSRSDEAGAAKIEKLIVPPPAAAAAVQAEASAVPAPSAAAAVTVAAKKKVKSNSNNNSTPRKRKAATAVATKAVEDEEKEGAKTTTAAAADTVVASEAEAGSTTAQAADPSPASPSQDTVHEESEESRFFAQLMDMAGGNSGSNNNKESRVQAELGHSSPSALHHDFEEESTLVYNALTGRMTSETSASIQCLTKIGFGINEQRQLYLARPQELNDLAERVRAGTATLPSKWPVTIGRTLGTVLNNKHITNPAEAVRQMMQIKINSVLRSRYASVVSADGGSGGEAVTDEEEAGNREAVASGLIESAPAGSSAATGIHLNEEQERVIEIALRGHHMYIGGSAGTGKTVLLRVLSRRLQAHRLRVAMTATTGVAGCHISGCTFHHAFGVSSRGEFLRRSTLLDYDVIIIDEVSMLPQRLFEDFDRVLREEAGTPDLPFGGVQIILCGDFLQLGCVNESSILHSELFLRQFVKLRLQTQVRQSAYPKFAADLQRMRLGEVPPDLTQTVTQLPAGTMVASAVNLLPTNKEVHAANEKELARLPGDPLTLSPETGITALRCDTTATLLLRTSAAFNENEFAKHVRALLQATLDLPRASLLTLYRIYEDGHAMRVMLPPGESVAWREAMRERFLEIAGLINDLDLGAVVTEIVPNGDGLHTPECEEYLQRLMAKHPVAQPLTFKKGCRVLLRANLSSSLVNGSIGTVVDFVECKRENFPDYLRNENVDECIERYRVFCFTECGMPIPMVPVVKFHSGEKVAVPPWEFVVGGMANTHYYSLSSVALPLTLAYAFTVHKVQGLTLVGRVHLELSRMWPCDHLLYVAMSRVRNPEQLSMSSFSPGMVVANETSVAFDKRLRSGLDLTNADLVPYPVSAWKRCNDTIYHLRRRGSSLKRLLQEIALGTGHGGSTITAGDVEATYGRSSALLTSHAAANSNNNSSSSSGANNNNNVDRRRRRDGNDSAAVTDALLPEADGNSVHYGSGGNGSGGAQPGRQNGALQSTSGTAPDLRTSLSTATLVSTTTTSTTAAAAASGGRHAPSHHGLAAMSLNPAHIMSIEHSVLVARRMRKLVKHVERVAKLTEARKAASKLSSTAAAAAAGKAAALSHVGGPLVQAAAEEHVI